MTTQPQAAAIPPIEIRHRLLIAREWAGMEQAELAKRTQISRNTISNYETGATTHMKKPYLNAIALATGVPIEWILTGETPPGPDHGGGTGGEGETSNPLIKSQLLCLIELAAREDEGTTGEVVPLHRPAKRERECGFGLGEVA